MDRKLAQRLGQRVRDIRESKGFTQAQLAEMSGKSVEAISNFERGQTLPGVRTLSLLANHLGVSLRDIFDFGSQTTTSVEDGLADRARLLSRDDRQLASDFVDFLIARRRRSGRRHSDD
jgi:transcriptional regulator with XRE-family HTH domain